jgi:hypothetical protein
MGSYIHDLHLVTNTSGGDDDYGAVGLMMRGSDNEIAFNVITHCIGESYDYGVDGGVVEFFGSGDVDQASNNYFHHNWLENNEGVVMMGARNNAAFFDNVFAYNVMINNARMILAHTDDGWAANVRRLQFYNNTVYENRAEWVLASARRSRPLIDFSDRANDDTLVMRNNIFYLDGVPRFMNDPTMTHDHNLYYVRNGDFNVRLDSTEMEADPRFANVGGRAFELMASSPAIDAGVGAGFSSDYAGNSVPAGASPDLGAYESQ